MKFIEYVRRRSNGNSIIDSLNCAQSSDVADICLAFSAVAILSVMLVIATLGLCVV